MVKQKARIIFGLAVFLLTASAQAEIISIIIDDLGYSSRQTRAVTALPDPVTLAIIPGTPAASETARIAVRDGHEVMLHLPMQSVSSSAPNETDVYHLDMLESEFKSQLAMHFEQFPDAIGVNNHMGSLLTRHPGHMRWLMETLADYDMYFVDSRTTHHTVAAFMAEEFSIPHTSRNVFLDYVPGDEELVEQQIRQLVRVARQEGQALAIGHPHAVTMRVLRRRLPELKAAGFELLPVSQYIQRQEKTTPWRVSSSPLPKAAKN